jgi:copper(I)-binding protein
MFGKSLLVGAMLTALAILPAAAQHMHGSGHDAANQVHGSITVSDAYARSVGAMARTGAVFLVIGNNGETPDRLVGARSDAAARVELHTHVAAEGGIMRMVEVEEGCEVPAGGSHALQRGGDHVMFLGLTAGWNDGDTIPLVLVFEQAGEIAIDVPVDLTRGDGAMTHGGHNQ